jgi:hypothetical protein
MGAMAKNNPKLKRPRPSSDAADGAANRESSWSSIPGHRLKVDIADKQKTGVAAAAVKEHQQSDDDDDDDSFDDDAFLNTSNWTSQHYDRR